MVLGTSYHEKRLKLAVSGYDNVPSTFAYAASTNPLEDISNILSSHLKFTCNNFFTFKFKRRRLNFKSYHIVKISQIVKWTVAGKLSITKY